MGLSYRGRNAGRGDNVSATATESVIVTTVTPEEEQTVAATVKEPVIIQLSLATQ